MAESMMMLEIQWNWREEAKKLGYTVASEEREREYKLAQVPPLPREISAED